MFINLRIQTLCLWLVFVLIGLLWYKNKSKLFSSSSRVISSYCFFSSKTGDAFGYLVILEPAVYLWIRSATILCKVMVIPVRFYRVELLAIYPIVLDSELCSSLKLVVLSKLGCIDGLMDSGSELRI